MLRVILLALPLVAISVLPIAAEGSKASFTVGVTIVPMDSVDDEAGQTTLIQATGAPVLSPAPTPKAD